MYNKTLKFIISLLFIAFTFSCDNSKAKTLSLENNSLKLKIKDLEDKLSNCNNTSLSYSNKVDLSEEEKIVKLFGLAKSPEEMAEYIINPDELLNILKKKYKSTNLPLNFTDFNTPLKLRDKIFLVKPQNTQLEFYVIDTEQGYKIDWLASTGYNETSLVEVLNDQISEPKEVRIIAKMKYQQGIKENIYRLVLSDYDWEVKAFGDKNTEDGKKLYDLIKNGDEVKIIAKIKFDKEFSPNNSNYDKGNIVINSFIKEGWF